MALVAITALAFFVRFYRLDTVPAGLFWDEAYEGLDAYSLAGKPFWAWPLFFTAINGREPLYVYLVHLAQGLLGPTTLAVRVVSAGAGALLAPALAWLGFELGPDLGVRRRGRFALWTALASLALLWTQTISRLGQRISLFVLLETLVLAALWRAVRTNSRRWWFVAGIAAGLSFYTYLAVRALPLALIACFLWAFWRHRAALLNRWRNIALAALVAAIVAGPLLAHFIVNPGHFSMRTSQVDLLGTGGLRELLANTGRVLGMAFVRGDPNGRLNYPDRPVLDLLALLPFLLGLTVVLRRFWRPGHFFLLTTLVVMLMPSMLSGEAPNFGRSSGALPCFVLLLAVGVDKLADAAELRWPRWSTVWSGAGSALLLGSAALAWQAYFVEYAGLPDLFRFWDTGHTEVAQDIVALNESISGAPDSIYADAELARNPSVEYLTVATPPKGRPHSMDGRVCVRIPREGSVRYYLFTSVDTRGAALLSSYLPDSTTRVAVADESGSPWATTIDHPDQGRIVLPEMTPHPVQLEDGIGLLGYWISQRAVKAGDRLYVRLFWQVASEPQADYITFVHLSPTSANAVPPVAGVDASPGNGACPTSDWKAGELIVDELQLVVPAEAPAGPYAVTVGMYRRDTLQRLLIAGTSDDQVSLGDVSKAP